MLFLLQNNYVEAMTGVLARALTRAGRAFHDFSLVPGEPLPEPPCPADLPRFYYGSTGMLRRLHRRQDVWVFDNARALDQRECATHRAPDLLNGQVELLTLGQLQAQPFCRPYFVRPVLEQKAFAGQVIASADLAPLFRGRHGIVHAHDESLLVAVSPVVDNIVAEYRFVVLGGKVRLGSRYRLDGTLSVSAKVPAEVWAQADQLAQGWLPAPFVVMDVALLADGRALLVEFNSVHSSGLYAIPGEAFAEVVAEALALRIRA
jgi:hypothetical protein